MTDLIREQILQVTVMFGAGISVALLYQLFQVLTQLLPIGWILQYLLEIGFWVCAFWWTSQFLYYSAYGRLSVHAATGFGVGVLLWKVCFYDIIDKIYINIKSRQGMNKNHGEKEKKQSV